MSFAQSSLLPNAMLHASDSSRHRITTPDPTPVLDKAVPHQPSYYLMRSQRQQTIQNLESMETDSRHHNFQITTQWLDRYLDLGLQLALQMTAPGLNALKESWLQRLYRTLRALSIRTDSSNDQRQQAFARLYQVFFALKHSTLPSSRKALSLALEQDFQRLQRLLND